MKQRPLTLQIWIVLASVTVSFSIITLIFIFFTLRTFFMNETYQMIENSQMNNEVIAGNLIEQDRTGQENRGVNHIVFLRYSGVITKTDLPSTLLSMVYTQAFVQKQEFERYTKIINGQRIYYVIKKLPNKDTVLVSYMWDSYLNDLVRTLFQHLLLVIFLAALVVVIPAVALAQYVTKPLRQMERHVRKMAEKDWHEPLPLEIGRGDEIGSLAESIEKMRRELVHQDETQKSMLQHVSHELKTPVMVIRSYAQSIEDGVFPKGDLIGSIHVIQDETERLEKRVKDLLYLTRLDYFANEKIIYEAFSLFPIISDVKERLQMNRTEINIEIHGDDIEIHGDYAQWVVAFENILDNQLRYAESMIKIDIQKEPLQVRIWNDGPFIEENMRNTLFETFQTGKNGKFGLGLAIVKRIANLHQAEVSIINEENGVAFYIKF